MDCANGPTLEVQHVRGKGSLGRGNSEIFGPSIGGGQKAANSASDCVLGQRRISQSAEFFQTGLLVLKPKPTGLKQVRRNIFAENLKGSLDPRPSRDGCAGRSSKVRVIEVGEPVGGGPHLTAHPTLFPGQYGGVRTESGKQRPDGIAIAHDDTVGSADLATLGGHTQTPGCTDQGHRGFRSGGPDLKRSASTRFRQ